MFTRFAVYSALTMLFVAGWTGPAKASTLYPDNQGIVKSIKSQGSYDLVIINGGSASGFRAGMLITIAQGSWQSELQLVAVEADRSAAIILNLADGDSINAGDVVRIKTRRI